ncbi:BON domain-containing protein [Paraburkholderia acidisoli]|uniref:BON domain-containing protein n=1 Tax=Paraburkholderia acidisoli TaxID=2571748 RepID=A0A7Z2GFB7_9BURK|nr:BON domain-containing protein [Paraburkholderia acidisoli]QGZ60747.1 BON domain-containing protein [Paraburkholderia acidisoli]
MKSVAILKTLGLALALTVAGGAAYAQDNSASAPAATASAKPAPTAKKADRKLGYTVRKALSKTQGVDVSNITVRSRAGAVTLSGTVPDQGQIDKAGSVARGVAGVKSVSNKLTVMQQ